jgi:hypothetical protein
MPYASLATALPAVPARALGVDVALLLRKAITRHALDAPTPATDAPVLGPHGLGVYKHHGTALPYGLGTTVRDTFDERTGTVHGVRYQVGTGKAAAGMISVYLRDEHGASWHARTSVNSNRLSLA